MSTAEIIIICIAFAIFSFALGFSIGVYQIIKHIGVLRANTAERFVIINDEGLYFSGKYKNNLPDFSVLDKAKFFRNRGDALDMLIKMPSGCKARAYCLIENAPLMTAVRYSQEKTKNK